MQQTLTKMADDFNELNIKYEKIVKELELLKSTRGGGGEPGEIYHGIKSIYNQQKRD